MASRACSLLRSSSTETTRLCCGSGEAAVAFSGGAAVGAVAHAEASTRRRKRMRMAGDCTGPATSVSFLAELEAVLVHTQDHLSALFQIPEEDPLGERLLQRRLDQPRHRPRAELRREAAVGEPVPRLGQELQLDVLLLQLRPELVELLVDDALHHVHGKAGEGDPSVEAVAELGREGPLDRLLRVAA